MDRIEDRRKRWNQLRVRKEDPLVLVVRFVKSGKNSSGNSCEPGEVWKVDEEFAYSHCRGRSPLCELATEAELKAYRAKLIEIEAHTAFRGGGARRVVRSESSRALPRFRALWMNSNRAMYSGSFSCEMPR